MSHVPFRDLRKHDGDLLRIRREAMRCSGLDEARRLIRQVREVRYFRAVELMAEREAKAQSDERQKALAMETIRPRPEYEFTAAESQVVQAAEVIPMPAPRPTEPEPIAA